MAINLQKISKAIDLDLSDIPDDKVATVKKEVGEYVIDEILDYVSKGKSPVIGEKRTFKRLNPDYARENKDGNTTANLELDGDLLDALTFKSTDNGVEIGVFKSSEVPKADGHNNFTGKSKLPRRRFIPEEDQNFRREIQTGIKEILEDFKTPQPSNNLSTLARGLTTSVAINDLFTDEGVEAFLISRGFIDG